VYGEQFLGKHLNMDDVAMDQVIEERGVNVIVARTDSMGGLASRLVRSPEWSLVHLDSRNLVFVRNIPPHEAVIAQWRIDPEEPWSPRDPEPTESLASWQQLIGARARPTFESGMVRAFLTIGAIDNAETYARRGLARFPDNAEFQLTLAQILRSRGRSVEAEELAGGLELSDSTKVWAKCLLADILQREGRIDESIAPLEEALAIDPKDGAVADALARLRFGRGEYAEASVLYRRIVSARPNRLDIQLRLGFCLEQVGDRPGAIEAYRAALRVDPLQYAVFNQLGTLLAQERVLRGASAAFSESLRLNPSYEPARKNLEFLQSVMQRPVASAP
jgi:tetratricopeptide (TPR) repeat protein